MILRAVVVVVTVVDWVTVVGSSVGGAVVTGSFGDAVNSSSKLRNNEVLGSFYRQNPGYT